MGGPAPDARDPELDEEIPEGECEEWADRGAGYGSLVCYRPSGHVPPVHWDVYSRTAWWDEEWFDKDVLDS